MDPELAYPIILGKPWMEANNVVYTAVKHQIKIGREDLIVKASNGLDQQNDNVAFVPPAIGNTLLSSEEFIELVEDDKVIEGSIICAASIEDKTKDLQRTDSSSSAEIKDLSSQLRVFASPFMDDDPK